MKKKLIFALIAVLVCTTLLAALSACGGNDDDEYAQAKPDIKTALNNYDELPVKKSDFTAELTVTIHRLGSKNKAENLFVKEKLALSRILNDEKIYAEGSLKTDSITESLPSTYKTVRKLIAKGNYQAEKDSVLRYLEGKNRFEAKLGYADGSYNLKMENIDEDKPVKRFWGATDNESVNELLKELKVDATVDMSKYLMLTGIIDLTDVSDWLSGDAASKYLSSKTKNFIYNITADPDKLNDLLFKYIEKFAALFGKEDYAEELELYAKVLPYIKQWVSFGPSTIDAKVSSKALPTEMDTTMQLKLNINKVQLAEVIEIMFAESKNKAAVLSAMDILFTALNLTDTDNKAIGTMGITFDFKITEKFSYGADACSLKNADSDMFIPATVKTEGREEFIYRQEEED